jgi:hypothetical protein
MAEARAMMNNPEFTKTMKEMQKRKSYQVAIKVTKDTMSDPTKAALEDAKLEHMAKVGTKKKIEIMLPTGSNVMDRRKNPAVMQEMMTMLQDPTKLKEQIKTLSKDSQFKEY